MSAGILKTLWIIVFSVSATLRITITTIYDVYRGTFRREVADGRLRWWSQRLLDLVDLRWSVVNDDRVAPHPGRPTIIMSNHGSLYDIPLIFVALPGSIRMLTKKELFRIPVWGRESM